MQEKMQQAKVQWNLKNVTAIYDNNDKAVYSSDSDEWGNVILKVNKNKDELSKEYAMLKEMNGKSSCRVFAYDAEHGLLIEERIIPGVVLRNEQNATERVNNFLIMFRDIHKTVDNAQGFETYIDWLNKADVFCSSNNVDMLIAKNMHMAHKIGEELFCKYDDRVLLHGDLHHDNMLLNDKGTYCMIDPKGVIGPEIFDLPRYILNEMDYATDDKCKQHISNIIEMISKKLNYPFQDIMKLFFMEVVLANVWCIEDGEKPNLHQILVATELLNE